MEREKDFEHCSVSKAIFNHPYGLMMVDGL